MLRLSSVFKALMGVVIMGALGAQPVFAGDRAALNVIGYSEDARYFAFEEMGVQDGSGFAYSSIYLVDLAEDRWVVGTPVAMQAETETESLADVRQRAYDEILPRLNDLSVVLPALPAALNGDGSIAGDRTSLRFGVPGYVVSGKDPNPVIGSYELTVDQFDSTSSLNCTELLGGPPQGYALTISDIGASRVIHRDRSLPRSRGCPTGYTIYGVYLPFGATDISNGVALLSVYSYGFEGADRRFVSAPLAAGF